MRIENEALALMSNAEKAEFAIWADFLEGKGYELLTQFLSGQAESIHSIIQKPSSWDEHIYARGQRDALNYVLNLESILEARVSEKIIEAELEEVEESLQL
jgi:hypothetical protein